MKKLAVSFFCLLFGSGFIWAGDLLTGDAKTACEMALCHPVAFASPGCGEAFSKWHSLVKKGKSPWDFMRKCPGGNIDTGNSTGDSQTDDDDDTEVEITACTAEEFNKHTDSQSTASHTRTMAEVPESCKGAANLPKYICDGTFYDMESWERGYTMQELTMNGYQTWIANGNEGSVILEEKCSSGTGLEACERYYKHIPIVKKCWVDSGSSDTSGYDLDFSFDSTYAWDLAYEGIKGLSSLASSSKSSSSGTYKDDTKDDDGSDGVEDGDDTGSESDDKDGSSGSSLSSSGSGSSGGFGGMSFGGGMIGSSAGSEDDNETSEEEEEEEEYGGNVSLSYKDMSDMENYGNYTAIVKQVIEDRSQQEK